jgi:gliding motility-associated protein GldM
MINIMYLVLTALLALNVSAEIFNAFKVVDQGLNKSNSVLDADNALKPGQIETLSKKKKEEYQKYAEQAPKVRELSEEFSTYIDGIVDKMIDDAGDRNGQKDDGDYRTVQGVKELRGKKNKDVTTRFLIGDKKAPGIGEELKDKILEYRDKFLELVDEEDRAEFEANMSLNIDDETWKSSKDKKSWAEYYFKQMPLAATLPIFTKFKNDAKSVENAILDRYLEKVGGKDIVFDEFAVVSAANKSYLTRGESYTADIFLSAFSKNVENLSVRVNGQALPIQNGVAKFSARPNTVGVKRYEATISFTNPVTKEVTTKKQTFEYEVGERSASISLDKMNKFYVGVDNPISVSAAGVSSNDLKVSISGAGATISKVSSAQYNVKPKAPGKATLTLSGGGLKAMSKEYIVRPIPDPVVRLGGLKVSRMGNGTFKSQNRLSPVLENFDFDAKCNILGYQMVRVADGKGERSVNAGANYNADSQRLAGKAQPGNIYYYENIKCKCPGDAASRSLPDLIIRIK